MIPTIDRRATGVNIRRIMDKRNISVKDLQYYLGLGSIQSIYHWLNGICLPSLDNLYAMSRFFRLPMDDLICGSEPRIQRFGSDPDRLSPDNTIYSSEQQRRMHPVSRPHFSRYVFWEFLTLAGLSVQVQRRAENYCG